MARKSYDFVGISSSQLPFVHASFPAAAGGPKYSTMRSVYRGRDEERKRKVTFRQNQQIGLNTDNKVIADLKLPVFDLQLKDVLAPKLNPIVNPPGNINRQKAYYKLKGIYMDKVFSVHRAKNSPTDDGSSQPNNPEDKQKRSRSVRKTSISTIASHQSNATLPIVNFKLPNINSSSERFSETPGPYSVKSEGSTSEFRSRLREMDREASPIPGIKPLRRARRRGRKLGNVVTTRRLNQLLDTDEHFDAGSFFFF